MNRRSTDNVTTQERELTLLFADLRGFTELAGSLEMDPVFCELLAHVMDCLTEVVAEQAGTIVDYYGDGLVAMWNAPADQPDHADRACGAALRMLERLPAVADEWIGVLQKELRLGIGVHTGTALVGNAGSTRQKKYGPRGANVNLTSRVEAATKEVRLPLLVTQATVDRLSNRFATHRACRAHMPGIQQPVDLYAVRSSSNKDQMTNAWRAYNDALQHFEQGRYEAASDALAVVDPRLTDVPTRFLMERVEQERGRQLHRRSTDKPTTPAAGVITLTAK